MPNLTPFQSSSEFKVKAVERSALIVEDFQSSSEFKK